MKLCYITRTFFALTFLSIFLWAGFNWTWWVPMENDRDVFRMFAIIVFHAIGIMSLPVGEGT